MRFRLILPLLALAFIQCRESVKTHNWFAMDTNMSVSLYGDTRVSDDSAFYRLEAETERLNNLYSDFSSRSSLAEVKGHIGDTVDVDPEIYGVLQLALQTSVESQGAFDFTLHDLKGLWGLGTGQKPHVPDSGAIDSLMRVNPALHAGWDSAAFPPPLTLLPGFRAVLHRENTQLDLGAIAKGRVIDRLHELLNSLGCPNHILQAGGEIRLGGKKKSGSWKVGIRHPRAADSLTGFLHTDSPKAISTSGDYERYFDANGVRYHHIFDPRTGRPAHTRDLVCAVTVVTESSMQADALSTSLFVLGPEKGAAMARLHNATAVWFEARPEGLCAIALPDILHLLDLKGVPACGSP